MTLLDVTYRLDRLTFLVSQYSALLELRGLVRDEAAYDVDALLADVEARISEVEATFYVRRPHHDFQRRAVTSD